MIFQFFPFFCLLFFCLVGGMHAGECGNKTEALAQETFYTELSFGLEEKIGVERAFYAASALRYFLEQIVEPDECAIYFNESDVDLLWGKLLEYLPGNENVILAHQSYYQIRQEKCLSEDFLKSIIDVYDIICLTWNGLREDLVGSYSEPAINKFLYPNLPDNRNISRDAKKAIQPYLIPLKHPLFNTIDAIFCQSRISQNANTFVAAGFIILQDQLTSHICLAKHPSCPGYLFKVYLDDAQGRNGDPGWSWLVKRCKGAEYIRDLNKRKKITNFKVPDKYLYPYPPETPPDRLLGMQPHPVILLVTDMDIVDLPSSQLAWKTKVTTSHLNELYEILSHGYGSSSLDRNVPYTNQGHFAFIDTEFPKRKMDYSKVKPFLSQEMSLYWDKLVRKGGP